MMSRENRQHNSGFHWGNGLTVAIILFICATLGIVGFITTLDYEMVTENHYEKAENYQEHIERVEQTSAMEEPVEIELIQPSQEIEIRFPSSLTATSISGTVELYRPNNSSMDRRMQLNLDQNGIQRIKAHELVKGKWLIKISWSTANKKYYKQENIFL